MKNQFFNWLKNVCEDVMTSTRDCPAKTKKFKLNGQRMN